MSPRRLLVVTTVAVPEDALRDRVRDHTGGEEADVRVVAPKSDLSPLDWLTNDDEAARREAREKAERTAAALDDEATVDMEIGSSDPVEAIEDALRQYPADEVILVTAPGDEATWLEEDAAPEAKQRFSVPVTHISLEA